MKVRDSFGDRMFAGFCYVLVILICLIPCLTPMR